MVLATSMNALWCLALRSFGGRNGKRQGREQDVPLRFPVFRGEVQAVGLPDEELYISVAAMLSGPEAKLIFISLAEIQLLRVLQASEEFPPMKSDETTPAKLKKDRGKPQLKGGLRSSSTPVREHAPPQGAYNRPRCDGPRSAGKILRGLKTKAQAV
jgi:hypothetical protein